MKAMTLRLPDDVHERLRQEAFDQRTSITALIVEALKVPPERELRRQIALDIQEDKPFHLTRDYTPTDAAYDRCAQIARGGAC